MERESGETLEVIYEEDEGQESDHENSYEFSEEYEYEAGVMPANDDEASSEPSFTSSGTHDGIPNTLSCNKQLGKESHLRSHYGTSILRGQRLLCRLILPAFDSIARRHARRIISHRNGVG